MHAYSVAKSCPSLWGPMDCSLPGFSVHRIFHTRILEWVTISFFKESSWPRDWNLHLLRWHWQTGSLPLAPPGKASKNLYTEANILFIKPQFTGHDLLEDLPFSIVYQSSVTRSTTTLLKTSQFYTIKNLLQKTWTQMIKPYNLSLLTSYFRDPSKIHQGGVFAYPGVF